MEKVISNRSIALTGARRKHRHLGSPWRLTEEACFGLCSLGPRTRRDSCGDRYNSTTKRVEVALQGWAKRTLESDYIVLASTHIDPKVDAARESGLEIDQVSFSGHGNTSFCGNLLSPLLSCANSYFLFSVVIIQHVEGIIFLFSVI